MDEQPNKDIVSSSSVKIDGAVQGLVQGEHNIVTIAYGHSNQASPPLADQNRQRFLAYLHTRYHDVLEQSLQGAALIALGLHTRPEAIAHPAHLVFRHLNQTEQVSGKGIPLLVFPPLRTARETFASSSSSLSFRPFDRTRLLNV